MYKISQIIIFFDNFIEFVCNLFLSLVYNVNKIANLKQMLKNLYDIATIKDLENFCEI